MPYPASPTGISYNIEAVPTPMPLAQLLAMPLGIPIENRIQRNALVRGLRGQSGFQLGGRQFADWLQSNGHGELLSSIRSGAADPKAVKSLEGLFSKSLKAQKHTSGPLKGIRPLGQSIPYAGSMLATDALMSAVRFGQNAYRKQQLAPAAASFGAGLSRQMPTLQVKGASKGEAMKKESGPNAAAMAGIGLGTAVGGEILGKLLFEHMNDRKRETSVGRNWNKLVDRYPEYRNADVDQRAKLMDLFEALNAVAPEIAKVPVLAAPMLNNAMEYGLQGFSASDLKTMADIGSKMDPSVPGIGAKSMPNPMSFANLLSAGGE